MKVKRYIVKDMSEAMIKIKSDLGIDAVILNTRKIKTGGFFRFFKKPLLEVVAAIDEPLINTQVEPTRRVFVPEKPMEPVTESILNNVEKTRELVKDSLNQSVKENAQNVELQELKQLVTNLIKKVENIEHLTPKGALQTTQTPEEKYIAFLNALDIQDSISKKILEIVQRQINIDEKNHETILNAMKVIAREYLGDIKTIDTDILNKPNIYMFLGPTGVGKTTTLAKIAARLSLVENKKIGLITADTYRIAAVE